AAQRGLSAVMPGFGVLKFLPAGCEHLLGTGEVRGCPPGEAEPEQDLGSMGQRPCLPYCVARSAEVGQSAAQVLKCLVESSHVPEDGGTSHEHATCHAAARGLHCPIQHGQAVLAAARPRE